MRLTVAGLGKNVTLDVTADETIASIKARLEAPVGLKGPEMKLVVKGKAPDDAATLGGLRLADGAKVMLLRGAKGVAAAKPPAPAPVPIPPSMAAPSWLRPGADVDYAASDGATLAVSVVAVHTDDPPNLYCTIALEGGAERQTPADRLKPRAASDGAGAAPPAASEIGEGPIVLQVGQGKTTHAVRCEPATTVRALKTLLVAPSGASDPAHMRLLHRGRELDSASTVDDLGLAAAGGGRLMLLFRGTHHRETEGSLAVAECSTRLADLRARTERLTHKITKRLLTGAEAFVELGAIDEEISAVAQDLRNAAPNETSDAAASRAMQLAECDAIIAALAEARAAEAQAQLHAQLGR